MNCIPTMHLKDQEMTLWEGLFVRNLVYLKILNHGFYSGYPIKASHLAGKIFLVGENEWQLML